MRALLLSTYELGHQPLHLASPAAALQRAGHEVRCIDLSVDPLDAGALAWADATAVSVPMHTAMRLALMVTAQLRQLVPGMPVCFYGLYATADAGPGHPGAPAQAIAGEYEPRLVSWFGSQGAEVRHAADSSSIHVDLGRQRPALPARSLLPPLERYARLVLGDETRLAGYVEASHGCAHRCRHCPVPVVYDGRTRIVGTDDVVADVAQLTTMGARHLTFGDPDFLNGPHHARRTVDAIHNAFPDLTFDITAKVEHILALEDIWPAMARAGCLFVVSAFESSSDVVLGHLDKGHTVAQEYQAVSFLRASGMEPRPSLLPFTPWTTPHDVEVLLDLVARCDLVGNVDPIQYAIRLLVPPGSLLLQNGSLQGLVDGYDAEHLSWSWSARDSRLDQLAEVLAALAEDLGDQEWDPRGAYEAVRRAAFEILGLPARSAPTAEPALRSRYDERSRPRLSEAWFCCAEPTNVQMQVAAPAAVPIGGR